MKTRLSCAFIIRKKTLKMKNLVILFIAFTISGIAIKAQTAPDWSRVLQTTANNYPSSKVVAADADNIIIAGTVSGPVTFGGTTYTSVGMDDLIIFKLNSAGTVIWAKQFNAKANGTIIPEAILVDANHNICLVGTFSGTATFGNVVITASAVNNSYIARFDAYGNVVWATAFSANGTGSSKIAFDIDGNNYLISKSSSLLKFSASGSKMWGQNFPDRTLQAINVYGNSLFIGGALQPGISKFGIQNITSKYAHNTGFMAKANLDGEYLKISIDSTTSLSTRNGDYNAVGILVHPTTGTRTFKVLKTLKGSAEDILSTTVADLSPQQGYLIIKINMDNSVTVTGMVSGAGSITQSGVNFYDPSSKKFTLNYSYTSTGGARTISEVLSKSTSITTSGYGSSISDFTINEFGDLIVTGAYIKNIKLGSLIGETTNLNYYTFIAQCNSNLEFDWTTSSNFINSSDMYAYRLFKDNLNNIYQYGISTSGSTTFSYGTVSVAQHPQFLFKFDAYGNVLSGYGLQNTTVDHIVVTPAGDNIITGTVVNDGTSQAGNFYVTKYSGDMSPVWQKASSKLQAGTVSINYVKHDADGNTYIQARIKDYCNFFDSLIVSKNGTTVNAKFNKSGDVLWLNQIDDKDNGVSGSRIAFDKKNNLLSAGIFETAVSIGMNNFNDISGSDGYIAKYSPIGQVLWAKQLLTDGYLYINSITSDMENNVIISGYFDGQLNVNGKSIDAGTSFGIFIIKFDSAGNCLWIKGYPIIGSVYSAMVSSDQNNNIYMTAEIYSDSFPGQFVFGTIIIPQNANDGTTVLVKFNSDGVPLWGYTYGGVASTEYPGWPSAIKTDAIGNTYLSGFCNNYAKFGNTTLSNPIGSSYSCYLTKINTNGEVVWAEAVYEKLVSWSYGDLLDLDKNGNIYIGGHFKDAIVIQGTTYNPVGTNDFFVAKYTNEGIFEWIKIMPANTNEITALSVYDEDVLSICGKAGKDSALGSFTIDRKGSSTCIIATLGKLSSTTTALKMEIQDSEFTLYPNPSSNYLLFDSDVFDAMIYIFDLNGKILLKEKIKDNKINISNLQTGVYTLKIVSREVKTVKKFVKL